MSSLFTMGGLAIALLVAIFFMRKSAIGQGKAQGRLEGQKVIVEQANEANTKINQENEKILADVEEVHEIHDRLESDPAYRKRVRDRFTRKD